MSISIAFVELVACCAAFVVSRVMLKKIQHQHARAGVIDRMSTMRFADQIAMYKLIMVPSGVLVFVFAIMITVKCTIVVYDMASGMTYLFYLI